MKKKVILFNALQGGTSVGIARYSIQLIKYLLKLDPTYKFLIAIDRAHAVKLKPYCRKFDNLLIYEVRTSVQRIFIEQFKLPLTKRNIDLIHYPDYAAPILPTMAKTVITVHDLSFLRFTTTFEWYKRVWKRTLIHLSCLTSDKIICVSHFTKDELSNLVPVGANKSHVIHNGLIKPRFESGTSVQELVPSDCYLLFVGTLEPRKNVKRLLKAFSKVIGGEKRDLKLVITGKKGWLYQPIFQTVKELNLNNKVVFTGFVSDDELATLYRNATALVYPSIYEGFGFPPLEAMAYGTPVITSNTSSLPEVVGNSAVLIEPFDTNQIADAIESILDDEEKQRKLREKGMERVKKFSWEKAAKETLEVYKEVLEG